METTTHRGGPVELTGRFRLAAGVRVLRRAADTVQIGSEPPHWRILRHAPAETSSVLDRLDGTSSLAEVLAGALADPRVWHPLLTELRNVGLLVAAGDRAGPGAGRSVMLRRRDAVVAVRGAGTLAIAVIELLSASGIGQARLDTDRSDRTGRGRPDRNRLLGDPAPTLVVLTDAAPPPDELADLLVSRWPHLAAHATPTAVVLGPFVLPGLSTCLLCILRHRNEIDLGWPIVEAALRSDPVEPPVALRALAAAAVTAEVLRAVDGRATPDTLDATLEWRGDELTPRRRSFKPHAGCACAAIGRRPGLSSPRPAPVGRQ